MVTLPQPIIDIHSFQIKFGQKHASYLCKGRWPTRIRRCLRCFLEEVRQNQGSSMGWPSQNCRFQAIVPIWSRLVSNVYWLCYTSVMGLYLVIINFSGITFDVLHWPATCTWEVTPVLVLSEESMVAPRIMVSLHPTSDKLTETSSER